MTVLPVRISRELTFQLIAPVTGSVDVPVRLLYDTADPFAVHLVFHAGRDAESRWVFARELLTLGLGRSSGEGHVRIWPTWVDDREVLRIALITDERSALLQAPAGDVLDFLSATFALCPWGTETNQAALDDELRVVLGGATELQEE
jgi:hypothetical protein